MHFECTGNVGQSNQSRSTCFFIEEFFASQRLQGDEMDFVSACKVPALCYGTCYSILSFFPVPFPNFWNVHACSFLPLWKLLTGRVVDSVPSCPCFLSLTKHYFTVLNIIIPAGPRSI
jgi:hypothetical protein